MVNETAEGVGVNVLVYRKNAYLPQRTLRKHKVHNFAGFDELFIPTV